MLTQFQYKNNKNKDKSIYRNGNDIKLNKQTNNPFNAFDSFNEFYVTIFQTLGNINFIVARYFIWNT